MLLEKEIHLLRNEVEDMRIESYVDKLIKYNKKTITKSKLEELFGEADDEKLYNIVSCLSDLGVLEPISSSHTNGNRAYPIYQKYRIIFQEDDFIEEKEEIKRLHPALQTNGILLKSPKEYKKYKKQLLLLDQYLFDKNKSAIPISRKERSFEIFGEEKILDDATFCSLLERLGIDKERLSFYDTPKYCFPDFIPEKKEKMVLLICENKDIWFNIRRRMFECHANTIFGVHIDGVIYGAGNQISEKYALTAYSEFMGSSKLIYLYWGDIDRAGFNIYLSLARNNSTLDISPFFPAYEEMLNLARKTNIPNSEDKREIIGDYEEIYSKISQENRDFLLENINKNKRIPQEIITYERLLFAMR